MKTTGTFIGGILLIAGSCIGAGMLALPIITGLSGFFPSLVMFLLAWGFMTITGLLMVEVNSSFDTRVNIGSMAERAFGKFGRYLSWVLYLFLFYSLLVAYISGSGSLSSTYFLTIFSWNVPKWVGAFFFTAIFGLLAYQGTRTVDHWNRFFMFGKIFTYLGMVVLGFKYITPELLLRSQPSLAFFSLPVLVIAFGYHNMVPTLMNYMNNDAKKVRQIILGGSLFALLIYIVWEIVVLGIVPAGGKWGIIESLKQGRQASDAVAGVLGNSLVSNFAEGLAFFALLSSFLAQTLALTHFLADAFKIKGEKHESVPMCLLALAPPLIFAFIYPNLFLKALNFAGGICAVILFGILPALMAWKTRYIQKHEASYQVFGGKRVLIAIIVFGLCIFLFQAAMMMMDFVSHV
ncbi:MAG TPA: aromatic amino acid transport family protein [Rhabdochlamydiaceae bacterium]|jgi:tyrosine-specific transport protein|nr:aromatic amino acid transport family protein [Rhabdochlamydiaceae bacterium]